MGSPEDELRALVVEISGCVVVHHVLAEKNLPRDGVLGESRGAPDVGHGRALRAVDGGAVTDDEDDEDGRPISLLAGPVRWAVDIAEGAEVRIEWKELPEVTAADLAEDARKAAGHRARVERHARGEYTDDE